MINTKIIKVPKSKTTTSNGAAGFANSVSITNKTDITVDSELSVSSTNPVENKVVTEAINDTITDISNTDNTLNITEENRQVIIDSNTWKYDEDGNLYFNGDIYSLQAILEKVIADQIEAGDITTENLTVTKSAHFFQLLIDEIKSTSGQVIITPANAKIDKVEIVERDYPITYEDGNGVHYNQVEYIENTGSAYINTGLKGKYNTKIDLTFLFKSVSGSDRPFVTGGNSTDWHYRGDNVSFVLYTIYNSLRVWYGIKNSGAAGGDYSLGNYKLNTVYNVQLSSEGFFINGRKSADNLTEAWLDETKVTPSNIKIFNTAGAHKGNLYDAKIYEGDTLIRDYIPVISENNVYGLFDKVNNTFYSSASSTAFR